MMKMGRGGNLILGRRLREHRERHRLTGPELAKRLSVTQGTISKLETGRLAPTIDYLSRFAHHLRLDRSQTKELINLAGVVPADSQAAEFLQFLPYDFLDLEWTHRRQEAIATQEKSARTMRIYQPHLVPGLLQTPEYARRVFALAGVPAPQIERSVAARIERQKILYDESKCFGFILNEAALATGIGTRDERLSQLKKLSDLARRVNIRIGLIPITQSPAVLPPPAFNLFDSDRVLFELSHGDLWLLDNPQASATYCDIFRELEKSALFGPDFSMRLNKVQTRLAA